MKSERRREQHRKSHLVFLLHQLAQKVGGVLAHLDGATGAAAQPYAHREIDRRTAILILDVELRAV